MYLGLWMKKLLWVVLLGRPIAEDLKALLEAEGEGNPYKKGAGKLAVILVGQGLGGALAVLNTFVVARSPYVSQVWTCTHGCPNVLDTASQTYLQEFVQSNQDRVQFLHVCAVSDPVPFLTSDTLRWILPSSLFPAFVPHVRRTVIGSGKAGCVVFCG